MSASRSGLRRALLFVMVVLLVTVGARALRSAITGQHAELRVEQVHEHDGAHTVTVDLVSVSDRDVLFDETFDVRPGGTLSLDLGSESVVVKTVTGSRARVMVEGHGRDAEAEFRRRRFMARALGGDLTVRTDPPRRNGWRNSRDAQFQVTVEIPRRYAADLDLGSGSVEVDALDGDLTVNVGSGSVNVSDVTGDRIVLDTGSGSVRARTLRGDVRIDTGSGSVQVDRVEGSLWVDTGSGRVSVGSVDGTAEVDTGSGSVELTMRSAREASVSTGSGSITLRLPRAAGFDVDLDGSSVRIDEAFGFRGDRERDEARGRLNGGGPRLHANTSSGSVRLIAS